MKLVNWELVYNFMEFAQLYGKDIQVSTLNIFEGQRSNNNIALDISYSDELACFQLT
jgi:hypothetical protein